MATKKSDLDTETSQEAAKTKDPVGKASEPTKAEPIAVAANEPYPTGSAPDPEDAFEAAHGFRRTPKKEG